MDTDLVLAAGLKRYFQKRIAAIFLKHAVMRDGMLGFGMIF